MKRWTYLIAREVLSVGAEWGYDFSRWCDKRSARLWAWSRR